MAMCVTNLLLFVIIFNVAFCNSDNGECSGKPTDKICDIFLMRMAWFYEPENQECRTFMYGGCGELKNIYRTEDDCYAKCSEKLVTLHPPWNLRVMAVQHNSAALIWYRPANYHLHEKLLKEYLKNIADVYNTVSNSTGVGTSSKGELVHIVPHSQLSGPGTNDKESGPGTSDKSSGPGTSDNTTAGSDQAANQTTATSDGSKESDNQTLSSGSSDEGTVATKNSSSETNHGNGTVTSQAPSTAAAKPANLTDKPPGNHTNVTDSSAVQTTEPTPPSTEEGPGNTSLNLKDYLGKKRVPFHFARLTHYVVSYKAVTWPYYKNVTVPENASFVNLSDLHPNTEYFVKVSAEYHTNTSLETRVITFRTRQDPTVARKCYCDRHGTVGGRSECNMSMSQLPWCQCLPGYSGLFCEICGRGFYRTGATMPCHKCPCTMEASTGSCHFVEGYLHCLKCREEYSGILCHRCANGYYRDYSSTNAVCRKCVGCHNISPGLICDPFSGTCLNCHYNTTGEQCDKCLPGFVGDPLKNVPCEPGASTYKPPPSGVIASIVVGTIVLLSGIVGIIVYRRIQRSPVNRPFWTIEFQEDHEGVNFSSVPKEDAERNVEDLQFYEDHQKTTTKSQPYSRLQEEF